MVPLSLLILYFMKYTQDLRLLVYGEVRMSICTLNTINYSYHIILLPSFAQPNSFDI